MFRTSLSKMIALGIVVVVIIAVAFTLKPSNVTATSADQTQLTSLCNHWLINGQTNRMAIDGSVTWALVDCFGTLAGGEFVAAKTNGAWAMKFGGGGTFTAQDLVGYGVPLAVATQLVTKLELQPTATPGPTPTPSNETRERSPNP